MMSCASSVGTAASVRGAGWLMRRLYHMLLLRAFDLLFLRVMADLLVLSLESGYFLPQLLDLKLVLLVRLVHLVCNALNRSTIMLRSLRKLFLLLLIDLS